MGSASGKRLLGGWAERGERERERGDILEKLPIRTDRKSVLVPHDVMTRSQRVH